MPEKDRQPAGKANPHRKAQTRRPFRARAESPRAKFVMDSEGPADRRKKEMRARNLALKKAAAGELTDGQAEFQPRIQEALAGIDQIRAEMQAEQPEIDRLKAETRAILDQLEAA